MMDYRQLKLVYEKLYSTSLEIADIITKAEYNDLETTIRIREDLLKRLNQVRGNSYNESEFPQEIQDLMQNLEAQDTKNIEVLEKLREEVRLELQKTNQNRKLISAYEQPNTAQNMVDLIE